MNPGAAGTCCPARSKSSCGATGRRQRNRHCSWRKRGIAWAKGPVIGMRAIDMGLTPFNLAPESTPQGRYPTAQPQEATMGGEGSAEAESPGSLTGLVLRLSSGLNSHHLPSPIRDGWYNVGAACRKDIAGPR